MRVAKNVAANNASAGMNGHAPPTRSSSKQVNGYAPTPMYVTVSNTLAGAQE